MVVAVATGSLCPARSPRPPRGRCVLTSVNSHRAALRRRPSPDGVGVRSRAPGGDRLGGRSLPARRADPAPARRRLAGGPDGDVRGRRDGRLLRRHVVRAGGLRHHAAERAHGPAHGARDGGPAGPGARRAGHARAAHAPAHPPALAAGGAALAGREGAVRSRRSRWRCTSSRRGRSTSRAGTRHAGPRLAARADAPAPGRGRARCSSGRSSASTRCRGGSATRPGCCWWCSRCRSTRSWGSRSWARTPCSAATTTSALRDLPGYGWLPDPLDDQHLAGGLLWASGDLVGLVLLGVLFAQWVRSSMKEAAREDRRLDLLEARARESGPGAER